MYCVLQGVGESEPNPYFYQNLAEAEFSVCLFMYMRLIGYPAEEITILTTYNGQKHLIRDVIRQRCGNNPLIGWPNKVTTVDRFQGQQNNYIILSLVRTKHVGHIRFVVSTAIRMILQIHINGKLGTQIFCRLRLPRLIAHGYLGKYSDTVVEFYSIYTEIRFFQRMFFKF